MINKSHTISVRVLHADPLLAAGLRALIDQAPGLTAQTGMANSGQSVEIIVADYASSQAMLGGEIAAGDLAARPHTTRVIVVTRRAREAEVLHMLQLGAQGYLSRNSNPRELIDAIRHIAHGGARYLCRHTTALVSKCQPQTRLTTREEDVLRLLVRGDCNKGIARELAISASTVKSHVSAICLKLHASTRARVAIQATRRGLAGPAA